jgi:hypothetical protein
MSNNEYEDISLFRLHQLKRSEEPIFSFHQFIREKCFEYQNKFDRTLVFISSGAIVLSYSLFDSATTKPLWVSLFSAMLLWAATFVVSLVEYMRNIQRASRYVAQFGGLCILALRQHTVEDSIKGLQSFLTQYEKDRKRAKNDKKLIESLSSFVSGLKEKTESRCEMLTKSAETSFAYNEPQTACNVILLCLLVGGCVAFGSFTYLKHCAISSSVQIVETTEVQTVTTPIIGVELSKCANVDSIENTSDEEALDKKEQVLDSVSRKKSDVENNSDDKPGGEPSGN